MNFGQAIRDLRGDVSQRAAAKGIGISHPYLCDIERGKAVPSLDVLVRLAAHYGVRLSELVRRAEEAGDIKPLPAYRPFGHSGSQPERVVPGLGEGDGGGVRVGQDANQV